MNIKPLNLIEKVFLLKKTRLFGNLDLDILMTISDKMGMMTSKEGTKIFHLNHEATRIYLIVQGYVMIQDRDQETIAELSPGDFFGDEAIFNEKPRSYEALCKIDCVLLSLSRPHLLAIISECPSVALALLEVYSAGIDFRKR